HVGSARLGKPFILAGVGQGARLSRYASPALGGAGFVSGFFSAGLASAGLGSAGLAASPARLRLPSFLKSVSYQPPPARRKLGAVTLRRTAGLPHSGQASGSGSDNFCRWSNSWPQASQEKA